MVKMAVCRKRIMIYHVEAPRLRESYALWCNEHLGYLPHVTISYSDAGAFVPDVYHAVFKTDEDATLFALRFPS